MASSRREIRGIKNLIDVFTNTLDTHHLDAQQCIFIDDKQDNILAAQSVGMRGILCDNHTNVVDQLKNYGIWYDTASTPL